MGTTTSISIGDIEALAKKLDAVEGLDDAERVVLAGVFELAGRAVADQDEVQGFGVVIDDHGATQGIVIVNSMPQLSLNNSFNLGFGNPGASHMGAQPHMGTQ